MAIASNPGFRMSSEVIETLSGESTDLALHVELCEQRYKQLLDKIDTVDKKFDKLETMLVEIKESITGDKKDTNEKYLKWAGATIFVLTTTLTGVLMHVIFK